MTLLVSLPATSAVNAIAYAIETLYAPKGNPIINTLAVEGIQSLSTAVPELLRDPADVPARLAAQYGARL